MKYLESFDNFEEYIGLPSEQEEDLREIFYEFIINKDFNYQKASEYFQPGSETLADFLEQLEQETEWFDYTQMDALFQEISMYLEEMREDEEEESNEDDWL